MGCDIEMHVEYRLAYCKDSKWCCGDYYRIKYNSGTPVGYEPIVFFDDRNYSLFATLADVRNYGGTAYISEPKGLPEDITPEVREQFEEFAFDNHSASYLTLRELIDFHEAKHPLKFRGLISPEAQKQLDDFGILPDTWCQGTSDPTWKWREWEEENTVLIPLIDKLIDRADELRVCYKLWWESADPKCRNIAYELANDIRIVFWFDN